MMKDDIVAHMFPELTSDPDFISGQTVRVLSTITVNMPTYLNHWLGAKCKVLRSIPRGLFGGRDWCYELLHPNGHTCEFRSYELDLRYRHRK